MSKSKTIKITESTLNRIVVESIKRRMMSIGTNRVNEGVGSPEMTNAYRGLLDNVATIVYEMAKRELGGKENLDYVLDCVDSVDTFINDTKDYTRKMIFPVINKIYDKIFMDYDLVGNTLESED